MSLNNANGTFAGTGLIVDGLQSPLAGPFSLSIPPRSCLAITGPSGSGKSLLLRLVADLDAGTGVVKHDGVDRSALTAPQWRTRCPYVAATPGFWAPSAADHFDVECRDAARRLAVTLKVDPARFKAPIALLSTGERQRIALVRALLLDAPVLLLDEPTGPLDEETTEAVADLLAQRIADGLSLLLVTHDSGLAERLATDRREMRQRKFI